MSPQPETTTRVTRAGRSQVAARQAPLRRTYEQDAAQALVVDRAHTVGRDLEDPVRTAVVPGEEYRAEDVTIAVGNHRGVGGLHDAPNSGELLCAALAACQDSTIRMVADLLGVRLTALAVEVEGDVDLRGALAVNGSVRVGFQSMCCQTKIEVAHGTDPRTVEMLLTAAERSCVILDTLRHGVDVTTKVDLA
jgi:uncharacterized OsmC-like protein